MIFILIKLAKKIKPVDNWIKKLIFSYSLNNPKTFDSANEYLPLHCQEELRQLNEGKIKPVIYTQPVG